MSRLLFANAARLKRYRVLWGCAAVMLAFVLMRIGMQYREHVKFGFETNLDQLMFGYTFLIGILLAVFCSLFFGTEYSDGTIRNKLIIGYSRSEIYFTNLITSITVSFLLCLVYLAAAAAIGIPLFGAAEAGAGTILKLVFGTLVLSVTFCSLFTMLSMVCGNKTAVAVISILLVVVLFLAAAYLNSMLDAPEFLTGYEMDAAGNLVESKPIPNPNYLTGTKREIYEFLYDFLPSGQAAQYMMMAVKHFWKLQLYGVLITAVSTGAGVFFFERKDIK